MGTICGYGQDPEVDKAAELLIAREVYANQSSLVDDILSSGAADLPSWEDAVNLYRPLCPDCGSDAHETDDGWACDACSWSDEYEPDSEPHEVFEWWLVSSYLAEQLEERGEVMLSDGWNHWWGRCCTGQAILLDGIMQRIVGETGYAMGHPRDGGKDA